MNTFWAKFVPVGLSLTLDLQHCRTLYSNTVQHCSTVVYYRAVQHCAMPLYNSVSTVVQCCATLLCPCTTLCNTIYNTMQCYMLTPC